MIMNNWHERNGLNNAPMELYVYLMILSKLKYTGFQHLKEMSSEHLLNIFLIETTMQNDCINHCYS